MPDKMKYNTTGYQILTDSGFRPFVGISMMGKQMLLKFEFNDGTSIEVTPGHKFIYNTKLIDGEIVGVPIHANVLSVGDQISTMDGEVEIVSICESTDQQTYDLIEVGDHKYKTNSVISHNCEFLSSDPLLIDSMVIGQLESNVSLPIREDMGFKFWKQLLPNKTYLIGVDPATGSGEDFSTILVYDFQDLSMVAEWRSNTMSSPQLYAALKLVLKQIESHQSMAYFSIENNGVGEGVIALYENDEKLPENCEFVSEEGGNRLGMRTESRVKLRTCMVMKQLVESGKIEIKSEMMLRELKSYVSTRGSYAAQIGATDDLISALLIVLRLLSEMATYEQRAHELMNQYDDIGSFSAEDTEGVYDDDKFIPDSFVF